MKLRALLIIMSLAISLIPVAMITGLQNIQIATAFLLIIMVVTFAVSYVIAYFITRPLGRLTQNINRISKGDLEVQLERSEITEINELTESLDRVMASLKLAIQKVGVKKEEIFAQVVKEREAVETKYQHLLQAMDGWTWEISPDGRCTACTEKAASVLGQSPTTVIGQSLNVFFSPEQTAAQRLQITDAFTSNKALPFSLDHVMRCPDGRQYHLKTHVFPMKDVNGKVTGLYCYSRDKTMLDEIQGLNEKLTALNTDVHVPSEVAVPSAKASDFAVPQAAAFMLLFTDEMKIIDCSQSLSTQLGFPREGVLDHTLDSILAPADHATVQAALKAARASGCFPVTLTCRKADGGLIQTAGILEYMKDRNLFQYRPDL